ncbi:hypothetical protein D3C76_1216060 [compost metagenome]
MVRKFCRMRRNSLMSLSMRNVLLLTRNSSPWSRASALNSAPRVSNSSLSANGLASGLILPFSRREISSKSLIRSSAERSELSRCWTSFCASADKPSS